MYKASGNIFNKQIQALAGIILTAAFFLLPADGIEAGGKREIHTETAEGIDIWQQEFDVSAVKPGKYNVIIQAKDAAGNVGTGGPFNVQIDPNAGLPTVRIVYPEENAVMRGDIQLIGVASGRYGVRQVLLKLDDQDYSPVEGIEYWSRLFELESLSEGRHTVYAKAVDDKGLEGPEFQVGFIVDKGPPSIELSTHKTGDLASGNQKIFGIASDPNGIREISWSADGVEWQSLSPKIRRGGGEADFSFSLRTRNLADGHAVYYIRAIDTTGLASVRPYLFFIDNEAPLIEIISPERSEDVHGEFQITGRVIDTVGLAEFYYEWAGETGEIALRPGDPFWTVTIPVSPSTSGSVFRVTAVDKSGNVTTVSQRLQDNRRAKIPFISVDYPVARALSALPQDGAIYGRILPGFFPETIIMEGVVEEIPAMPGFRIPPELIPSGRSTLRLRPKTADGTLGAAFTLRVNKPEPPPVPEGEVPFEIIPSIARIDEPEQYAYFGDSVHVSGAVLAERARLEYRLFPEDTWKPLEVSGGGAFSSDISLTEIAEGPVHLEFRTIRDGTEHYPIYHPVNKFSTLPSIAFLTPAESHGSLQGNVTVAGTVSFFAPLRELSYSLDGENFVPLEYIEKYGKAWFSYFCDFTALENAGAKLVVRVVDVAGNVVEQSPVFAFDGSADKPSVLVNSPLDEEVITGGFEISGIAFDDDSVDAVYWRVLTPENPNSTPDETLARGEDTEYQMISTTQSFSVEIPFDMVVDGENIIEVYAADIYGVKGDVVKRTVKVSATAPVTEVSAPAIDVYNRRNIEISGTAFDLNGIKDVFISLDNGNSYQRADSESSPDGNCVWKLSLNTKAYQDGVYSVLIRTGDNYGITAFSNALINIDNTPPEIALGIPYNGESVGTELSVSGQAHDDIALKNISLHLVNINDASQQISYEMSSDFVIMEQIDVSGLVSGDYNLKLNAADMAGNETAVTRDIKISRETSASEAALINPMPGIEHAGPLHISGKVTGAAIPEQINLLINREHFAVVDVNRYGVFRYEMGEDSVTDGTMIISASYESPTGETISSRENEVTLSRYGPVITVDSHNDGDVVSHRPWISGRAFIAMPPLAEGETLSRKQRAENAVKAVWISFDNGRSYEEVTSGNEYWKYRIETEELASGSLPLILKADFPDGRSAIRRIILTLDMDIPVVAAIGPSENSTHRDSILVYGFANDEFEIDSVEVSLRPGDKAGYAVPQFIQGLYLDGNFMGATTYSAGLGLSFFENNVKLQVQAGQAPPGRFSGTVVGAKLIANILYLPFSYFFGPDWERFSMSLAMGANFSWFSMAEGEASLMMSALLAQWEFARLDMSYFFPKWRYFKTLSLYLEPIFWFASSDVAAGAIFKLALGARISLY
ncbi:MAG TPA: neuraminidase [Treponema sp.]|nr:neuraminidase [Treponema sp.]